MKILSERMYYINANEKPRKLVPVEEKPAPWK